MAIDFVRQNVAFANNDGNCAELLQRMDAAIFNDHLAGETTCVLVVVTPDEVFGASAGDSGAWLIPASGSLVDLTRGQQRKPFIGTGCMKPVCFRHQATIGRLLVATDGLLKYASPEQIIDICRQHPTDVATRRLVELVRYPSGGLPDDVTLILGEF